MMCPYRLLAIDVDGTLLNSRSELSEVNRCALHRAHEAGLKVCLCTGRNLTEARTVLDAIGLDLDSGVFVFGAIVVDLAANRVISRSPMTDELATRLITYFHGKGHPVLVLHDVVQAGYDYVVVEGIHQWPAYERWMTVSPTRIERVPTWTPSPYPVVRVGVIESPDRIQQTMSQVRAEFPASLAKINSIHAPNYGVHVVECFSPIVNKWHGIMQLASTLDITADQVAVAGDDINDLEMVANAGLGAAMGNAIEPVRSAANLHLPANDQHGVAQLVSLLLDRPETLPNGPRSGRSVSASAEV